MTNSRLLLIAIISALFATVFGVLGFFLHDSSLSTLDLAGFLVAIVTAIVCTVRAWVNETLRPLDGGLSPDR